MYVQIKYKKEMDEPNTDCDGAVAIKPQGGHFLEHGENAHGL